MSAPPPPPPPLPPPPPYDCPPPTRANVSLAKSTIPNSAQHIKTKRVVNRQLAIGNRQCIISVQCSVHRPTRSDSRRWRASAQPARRLIHASLKSACGDQDLWRYPSIQTPHDSISKPALLSEFRDRRLLPYAARAAINRSAIRFPPMCLRCPLHRTCQRHPCAQPWRE